MDTFMSFVKVSSSCSGFLPQFTDVWALILKLPKGVNVCASTCLYSLCGSNLPRVCGGYRSYK